MVEADGEWHAENGKYGSATWLLLHGGGRESVPAVDNTSTTDTAPSPPSTKISEDGAIEIGDSDSEGEQVVKRELSPIDIPLSTTSTAAASAPTTSTASGPLVIDLTLSDDEDAPVAPRPRAVPAQIPPPPSSVLGKRKFSSDGEGATGSSRRTSTAPSHKSPRGEGDDYAGYQDRSYSSTHYSHRDHAATGPNSPPVPTHYTSSASSPTAYHYSTQTGPTLHRQSPQPPLPSSTTSYNHNSHWQASRAPQPTYSLPPASSLLPPTQMSPASHRPLLPPPQLGSLNSRHGYERPSHSPHSSLGGSSSSTSRYAEWGIRP